MIYETIADLIYKGLDTEYFDPLEELVGIHSELEDNALAECIQNKIEEECSIQMRCPKCLKDLWTEKDTEEHGEIVITYKCDCGYSD
ncbi:MAG: hypothetical protein ACRDD7_12870 [Peptostreptococcaceae bacterium]